MPTRTATASARPTAVAEAEADYEVLVSSTSVDRRLLSGPFASHVWGGRYEVQRFAGEGSQGATFIGTDRKTGATVAMKLFDLGKAKDWKAQELFEREVATLKRLSHKGIPQFLDVIVDDATGARCLVMTHVAGDTLGEVQRRDGTVAEKRLWGFLVDAANVLAAVHGEGVVHRDLKPDNFILRPDGTLAIVDFGGVGTMRAAAGSTVVGTFGYMAPEQLYGAQTAATDLYALGATLLTLATNKAPEDQPRKGLAIDVDAAAPFLSEPLRKLLSTLLSPDPQARPKDGAALLVVLRDLAQNKSRPTRPPEVLPADGGAVDAIWRDDDVDEAVHATGGAPGVVFSVIGMLATFGFGRVLIPLVLTILATFVGQRDRQKLLALRSTVRERSRDAQRLLQRSATQAAATLEQAAERQRGGRTRRREQRRQERHEARAWTADTAERFAREVEERVAQAAHRQAQKAAKRANKMARRRDRFWHHDSEEL